MLLSFKVQSNALPITLFSLKATNILACSTYKSKYEAHTLNLIQLAPNVPELL